MNPSFQILSVEWCHDLFAQSHSCQLEMQENREMHFYNIWTFCKSSHNLVGMAHRNDKYYIFCQMITTIIHLYLCDVCEFLWRSGYHILGLQKVSKNWHLVRKKTGNFIPGDPWEPCSMFFMHYVLEVQVLVLFWKSGFKQGCKKRETLRTSPLNLMGQWIVKSVLSTEELLKISHPYNERCRFYSQAKNLWALRFKSL